MSAQPVEWSEQEAELQALRLRVTALEDENQVLRDEWKDAAAEADSFESELLASRERLEVVGDLPALITAEHNEKHKGALFGCYESPICVWAWREWRA